MADLMTSVCVIFTLFFQGKTKVKTELTNRAYSHRFNFVRGNGELRTIVLLCREYRHIVTSLRWYIPSKVKYTYVVEMVRIDNDVYSDHHVGHYPLLCHRRFVGSKYPHRCAINAHIDNIF